MFAHASTAAIHNVPQLMHRLALRRSTLPSEVAAQSGGCMVYKSEVYKSEAAVPVSVLWLAM